ncbi:MAG TPA: tRNA (adenosine(37)-N6)-threonylcarbamoyltransferase complex dimerization subunit type 1 TsaB [Candidatus Intestinimonas pullistercoris]|uniref:tRNA (Adenosine(37)-N6)-threonylcarbamoyltransferase complex dimerization subunit type 1 TsaB n=1 Tax=Candidatus Intestinimonas pullistercoris TaxID=2838623 RepID=A0A9D2P170_9FIRM|nr:tRNA (adenosine(37)-N6)-threonylcarbamoyltransferase complex dimerization subunit type 1 TsaB [Candidatus Intestinimonas pullistercoris]
MKILALESSAVAASVAVSEDGALIAQSYQRSGLTHSRTLLPMCRDLLENCGLTLGEMDVVAVAAGPGSFTGLRIGVATAKGLAWPGDKPCAGVSTLEAMAWPLAHLEGDLCAVMDARRHQVYNARFQAEGGRLLRLCPDRAISIDELAAELLSREKTQILVGDGAELCYNELTKRGLPVRLAPPHLRWQSAWGVARAAEELARTGGLVTAAELAPVYHRLSQAERERLARQQAAADDR